MALDRLVVISSIGDPRDRAIWSGTPHGLIAALERAGVQVDVRQVVTPRALQYVHAASNVARGYGRAQLFRVGSWAAHNRRRADRMVADGGGDTFLHFGSHHLPLSRPGANQRHFMLTDYSIDLLLAEGVVGERAPPRYHREALATERAIAEQMEAVFTVSRYVRDNWLGAYRLPGHKVVAVGTGLGQPVTLDGVVKDYRRGHLLFIARHSFDVKGGPLLLAGFVEALARRPDLRLVVIANAADPTLAQHLPTLRDHPSIDFHQSGTPDYIDLVRRAALFAGPAEREPWGLVYLESMMCETPPLGLDRNALPELTDSGRLGFLAREASPAAVADAIVDATSDPERLARMGREGRAFVERNYTWDAVARKVMDRIAG